jgi:hypothetical protein
MAFDESKAFFGTAELASRIGMVDDFDNLACLDRLRSSCGREARANEKERRREAHELSKESGVRRTDFAVSPEVRKYFRQDHGS